MTVPKPYDIRQRTFEFAAAVVVWSRNLAGDASTQILVRQLVRAATSVGANVEEADGTETSRDRINKWNIARKEAREARYWLRLIGATQKVADSPDGLMRESEELVRILTALMRNHKQNSQQKDGDRRE